MKISIESNIIKHCLQNVFFITGTAYAGKSTMVRMLAEKHYMIRCDENYHVTLSNEVITPDKQPNLCYFQTMKDWQDFINRKPDEYERWIYSGANEAAEIEIIELLRLSSTGRRIIVETNIPVKLLHEISDYNHVAIMLSSQSMSVDRFFDRIDADKQFILKQIQRATDPEKTMANFQACIAKINSKEHYDEYINSGFFTILRKDTDIDTKAEVLSALEAHFIL